MRFDNEAEVFGFGQVLAETFRNVLKEHGVETDLCINDAVWVAFAKLDIVEFRRKPNGQLIALEDLDETYVPDCDVIVKPNAELVSL